MPRESGDVNPPFFTIGHSTRTIEDFIELLRAPQIQLVVDVRTVPKSRANPQFNEDRLVAALATAGIAYERLAALGGLRGRTRDLSSDANGLWENQSFHNYADYALSAPFHAGLRQLREDGHLRRCAIMCAEAVWWRCHRRIIADYLVAAGETVFHIMGPDRLEAAHLTPGAIVGPDASITYPVRRADTA